MHRSLVSDILTSDSPPFEILRSIFWQKKASDRKVSLRSLSQKLGIRSTGYLADVMAGKRRINLAYVKPLAAHLNLTKEDAEILYLLFVIERESNETKRNALCEELSKKRGVLKLERINFLVRDHHTLFLLDVLATFELFDSVCRFDDIASIWGQERQEDITHAIRDLKALGLIVEESGVYTCLSNHLTAKRGGQIDARLKLLREGYYQACEQLEKSWQDTETCFFAAGVTAVDAEHHKKSFKEFRTNFLGHFTNLSQGSKDTLLRFAIAVYPVASRQKNEPADKRSQTTS